MLSTISTESLSWVISRICHHFSVFYRLFFFTTSFKSIVVEFAKESRPRREATFDHDRSYGYEEKSFSDDS
jgi:hypothetical protein